MSIKDRLYSRLEEKMGEKLGYRGDLYMADHATINKNTAKLLLGYNTTLGQPVISDISKFIVNNFEGRVSPRLETARIHTKEGAISLVISKVRPTRPIEDKSKMVAIAATLFLDQKLGDKWEVAKNGDKIYLARIDSDNIGDIVAQRMQAMHIKASTLTFAELGSGVANVSQGDTVRYFKNNTPFEGKVISVGPEKVTIKTNGTASAVDPAAIYEVVKVGPAGKKGASEILREYYSKAYPENYGNLYIDMYQKSGK